MLPSPRLTSSSFASNSSKLYGEEDPVAMPAHGPPSPGHQQGTKRQRQTSYDGGSDRNSHPSPSEQLAGDASQTVASNAKAGQSSNFRNVSACNRCRLRKNRCDQKLPSCASCAKAGVACVGYDPITKKEIPRRYEACARAFILFFSSSLPLNLNLGWPEAALPSYQFPAQIANSALPAMSSTWKLE